ncbi:MAG TPA: DUF2786 domain-containing protein, partial [Acidimicrobiia bacterium]|nr:DUF2786 domain-containing protein [Acidimicrobiia bacterium]
ADLQRLLEAQISRTWRRGWQPADVVRVTAKTTCKAETELVRFVIAEDAAGYEGRASSATSGWMNQLEEIEAHQWWDPSTPWVLQLQHGWRDTLIAGVCLLNLLEALPRIPTLITPPHEWDPTTPFEIPADNHLAPGVLSKVRALLAKAESTSFDAEAESLTAKAQELITRYRIDRAKLSAEGEESDTEVVGRRVGIDDPYAQAKSLLLAGIADANGCRSVWSKAFGFAALFGFPEDLDGVETLFTSLLVQATAALQREGSKQDRYGRSRTTRFRRSFLVAFATRISQRLRESTDATVRQHDDEAGGSLLPVLVARERAADAAVKEAYPELSHHQISATDAEGYWLGTRFGDIADLGYADNEEALVLTGSHT